MIKTTTKAIVDAQLPIYEKIHPEYRPTNIKRISECAFSYDFVNGELCESIKDIWSAAKIAMWQSDEHIISLNKRSQYVKYVLDLCLCDGLNSITQIEQGLLPILTDRLAPVRCVHGDMTCANAIHSQELNHVVFIDPADSHGLECQEIDEAKLLQSFDGWEVIKYEHKLNYGELPFKVRPVHTALLLSHYIRMLRYQTDKVYDFAIKRIREIAQ